MKSILALAAVLALIGSLSLGACAYTDEAGVRRSEVTGGALSDPTCLGFNIYGQGCHRGPLGNLVKTEK